jgi:hypothetical protein
MTLPGFSAEISLYRTTVHYRLTGTSVEADGVVPQQVHTHTFCGPCYLDETRACVQNCTTCLGHLCLPSLTFPCDPSACPPIHPSCLLLKEVNCGGAIRQCTNCSDPLTCDFPQCCFSCAAGVM